MPTTGQVDPGQPVIVVRKPGVDGRVAWVKPAWSSAWNPFAWAAAVEAQPTSTFPFPSGP